ELINAPLKHKFCRKFSAGGKYESAAGDPEKVFSRTRSGFTKSERFQVMLNGLYDLFTVRFLPAGDAGEDGFPFPGSEAEFKISVVSFTYHKCTHRSSRNFQNFKSIKTEVRSHS
ncbi:hypothetical protein, partial [Tamlana crocina]|uniref:hypothetical protein n=1 Tax=Tamlana crocina TaxID=393006 RepID=UPI001ADD63B0